MRQILTLFILLTLISCSTDNEEDYFALDCNTDNIYYINSDISRSISSIINDKCLGCHLEKNMQISGSWLPLGTHSQLISIDFNEHVLGSHSSMPPVGSIQLTECEKTQIEIWVNNKFPYDETGR